MSWQAPSAAWQPLASPARQQDIHLQHQHSVVPSMFKTLAFAEGLIGHLESPV